MNSMNNRANEEELHDLYALLLSLKTEEDCAALLEDLCTKKEVAAMAQRVRAARLLLSGETYEQIIAQTDISSATLSRVSRCVQYGEGYRRFLGKQAEE